MVTVDYDKKAIDFTREEVRNQLTCNFNETKSLGHYLDKYYLYRTAIAGNYDKIKASIADAGLENKQINMNHFARFMAERLSNSPCSPESVESMIWMLGEYTYTVLGVDRQLHIASHLRHAARGESSLHMMRDFYRDHFFHTIEVCLLGQVLADARPKGSRIISRTLIDNSNSSMKTWYTAALLHDIGYAVDVFSSLKDWLSFFTSDAFNSLGKGIDRILEKGVPDSGSNSDETMASEFKAFYEKYGFNLKLDKPFKDHGLMGALHIQTLVKNVQKINGNMEMPEDAIRAIAVHNCQRIKVDYRNDPLSALLIICDTLQSWQRPQFKHFSQGPAWMMSAMNHNTRMITPPQTSNAELLSNLKFTEKKKNSCVSPQFNGALVLRLNFDDAVNRDSFVFNIWLDALCNFQRIDFTRLPFNVIVQIKTPICRLPGKDKGVRQMDRLLDAATDTHMAYLDGFFKAIKRTEDGIPKIDKDTDGSEFQSDEPISYYYEGDKYELLSFSLREMDGDRQFVKNSISRFRKDLKGWRHFHDDRFLTGDYSPWQHDYF